MDERYRKAENMDNLLTIATVVFNDDAGLAKTHASLLTQTCQDFEWVVINGGKGVIKLLRCDKIVQEPDKGIYDAMNKAARHSTSPYIVFINAGDTLARPDTVQQLLKAIKRDPKADMVMAGFVYVDTKNREHISHIKQHFTWSFNQVLAGDFYPNFKRGIPNHNSICIRRELLLIYPYDIKHVISADLEHAFKVYAKGHKRITIAPTLCCKFNQGGVSTKRRLRALIDIREYYLATTKNRPAIEAYCKSALSNEVRLSLPHGIPTKDILKLWSVWPVSFPLAVLSFYMKAHSIYNAKAIALYNLLGNDSLTSIVEQIQEMKIKADIRLYESPPKRAHDQPLVVIASHIPPSLCNYLWKLGYKRFYHFNGITFNTFKNKPCAIIGTTDKGEPTYATN